MQVISMDRVLLSNLYCEFGVVQALIDVPVEDSLRGGFKVRGYEDIEDEASKTVKKNKIFNFARSLFSNSAKETEKTVKTEKRSADGGAEVKTEIYRERQEEEEANKELDKPEKELAKKVQSTEISAEEEDKIERYWRDHNLDEIVKYALKWGRLYGGSGIIINTAGKPEQPLELDKLKKGDALEFYHADCWELSGATSQLPIGEVGQINWLSDVPFLFYGTPIHKSRVLTFRGKEIPSLKRNMLRGWGMSALEGFIRTLNQFIKNQNVIYELLDEAKTNIFMFQGFNDAMQDRDATEAVMRRLTLGNMTRNYANGQVMDAEDQYDQKQMSFGGLAEILTQNRISLASDARIPETKLFGISSAGFNSGDDDIENYNGMIESEIRSKARYIIIKMLEVIAPVVVGKQLRFDIEFPPLREAPLKEQANIRATDADTAIRLWIMGIISPAELIDELKARDVTKIDIQYKEEIHPVPDMNMFVRKPA
jgi:phage-related protein (TIGR01555 family)